MQLNIEARMVQGLFISHYLHKINILLERKVGFRIYLLHSSGQDLQLPRGKGHKRTSTYEGAPPRIQKKVTLKITEI